MKKILFISFASWMLVSCTSLVEMNSDNNDEIYNPVKKQKSEESTVGYRDKYIDTVSNYQTISPYETGDTSKKNMLGRKYSSLDTVYSDNNYSINNYYENPSFCDDYYYTKRLLGFGVNVYSPYYYHDYWPYYSYSDWYWGTHYYNTYYDWQLYWAFPTIYTSFYYDYPNNYTPFYNVNRGESARRRMSFNDGYSNYARMNMTRLNKINNVGAINTRSGIDGAKYNRSSNYENRTRSSAKSAIAQNDPQQGSNNGTIYYPPSTDNQRRPSSSSSESYQTPQRQRSQWNDRNRAVPERNNRETEVQQNRQRTKQWNGGESQTSSQSSDSYKRPASSGTNSWGGTSNYRGGSNDGYRNGSGGGQTAPGGRRR